ncbi:MAG: adenylate cyclase [Gammaproteobacteria bacterium]|jgi:adenylate cyclase
MANETKLVVILHADVVGSTELVQIDEKLAHDRIQDACSRFSQTISSVGGTAQEIRGDAIVAEFARASGATSAALSFQAANLAHNEELDGEIRPELRVGIALGELVIADNTVTGAGVVLAQRLEQLAQPGGVCISAAIHEALPGRLSLDYKDLGEQPLKGFERPQRAYLVSFVFESQHRAKHSTTGAYRARSWASIHSGAPVRQSE